MFFLNLTAVEFFILLGTLAGFIATLYLLDRMKRKKVVSTLRFWKPALTAEERQSRRKMREPWSLVLQILSLLLLLLAIAQLQWGVRQRRGRDHVLLLDTSAWTAQKLGQGTLLDREKAFARRYLSALGAPDRAMVVRAGSLTIPATAFTSDHRALERAVVESTSGFSALNLDQALGFASQALGSSGGERGEIVYIGPGLVRNASGIDESIPKLRVIRVAASRNNCGIRHIGVKPGAEPGSWTAIVTARNYGPAARQVLLHAAFAGTTFAPRSINLPAVQERTVDYTLKTDTAGALVVELDPHDDLPQDDRAEVWLARNRPLRLAVFTNRPDVLRPLFEANHRLSVTVSNLTEYNPKPRADVMLLDEISVPSPPQMPCLWINPPEAKSPLPIKALVNNAPIKSWNSSNLPGAVLNAKDAQFPSAEVFETFADDVQIGRIAEGPVVVARPQKAGHTKFAVIGFDPFAADLRFQVTTPLLFADLVQWLSPEPHPSTEIAADQVGAFTVALDPGERTAGVRVTDQNGSPVPFTIRDHAIQLFAVRPGIVRVVSQDHERVVSLTLPDIADVTWNSPPDAIEGLPPANDFLPSAVDLWKWLATLAAAVLLVEWLLYGRRRVAPARTSLPVAPSRRSPDQAPDQPRELVSR